MFAERSRPIFFLHSARNLLFFRHGRMPQNTAAQLSYTARVYDFSRIAKRQRMPAPTKPRFDKRQGSTKEARMTRSKSCEPSVSSQRCLLVQATVYQSGKLGAKTAQTL